MLNAGAFVGAGWFAIEGALGSDALYRALTTLFPGLANAPYLGDWIALNLVQLITVFVFWGASVFFAFYGAELLKKFEKHAATLLISASVALFIWAWASTGSISGLRTAYIYHLSFLVLPLAACDILIALTCLYSSIVI